MRYTFIVFVFLLVGCEFEQAKDPVEFYRCTDEQLTLVDKEYEICTKSSYMDSFCFQQAKTTQCDKLIMNPDWSPK